jgi:hypothetical protein
VTDVFGEEDVLILGRQWLWENRATIEFCGVGNEAYQKLTVRPDEYNLENSTTIILRQRTKKEVNLLAPPPTPILDDKDHLRPAPRPIEVPTSCEHLTYGPMPMDEIDVAAKAALISMSMPKTYDERIKFTHQRQTRLGLPLDVVPLDEPNFTVPFGIAGADIIDTARVRIHAKGSYIAEDLAKRIVREPTLWEEEQPNLPAKDGRIEMFVSVKIPIFFIREYDFFWISARVVPRLSAQASLLIGTDFLRQHAAVVNMRKNLPQIDSCRMKWPSMRATLQMQSPVLKEARRLLKGLTAASERVGRGADVARDSPPPYHDGVGGERDEREPVAETFDATINGERVEVLIDPALNANLVGIYLAENLKKTYQTIMPVINAIKIRETPYVLNRGFSNVALQIGNITCLTDVAILEQSRHKHGIILGFPWLETHGAKIQYTRHLPYDILSIYRDSATSSIKLSRSKYRPHETPLLQAWIGRIVAVDNQSNRSLVEEEYVGLETPMIPSTLAHAL